MIWWIYPPAIYEFWINDAMNFLIENKYTLNRNTRTCDLYRSTIKQVYWPFVVLKFNFMLFWSLTLRSESREYEVKNRCWFFEIEKVFDWLYGRVPGPYQTKLLFENGNFYRFLFFELSRRVSDWLWIGLDQSIDLSHIPLVIGFVYILTFYWLCHSTTTYTSIVCVKFLLRD